MTQDEIRERVVALVADLADTLSDPTQAWDIAVADFNFGIENLVNESANMSENYSLSDCVNYYYNPMGDCSGRVEKVFGQIVCENCRNYRQTLNKTQVLRAIQANDPDGWTSFPNQKDYDEFKSWAIGTFGEEVWDEYHTNWDSSSDI